MIDNIRNTNWTAQNKFDISMTLVGDKLTALAGGDETLNTCLKNITLPDYADSPIEEYISETWMFARGKLENYLITLNFRDRNAAELNRYFSKWFIDAERWYADEQRVDIEINIKDSFNKDRVLLAKFENCMLIGVSGLNLDNEAQNTIAEFSVTFKSGRSRV